MTGGEVESATAYLELTVVEIRDVARRLAGIEVLAIHTTSAEGFDCSRSSLWIRR
jgi:hypothetical protein